MWGHDMMGWHASGDGVWWGLATAIIWLVVVALVTVAIVFLIKQVQQSHDPQEHGEDPAITILRARFARGEISSEQFEQIRQTLGERNPQRAEDTR